MVVSYNSDAGQEKSQSKAVYFDILGRALVVF